MLEIIEGIKLTKTSGEVVTIIQVDEKFKTAILESQDGTTRSYSFSTIRDKRRFIPATEEVEEVIPEEVYDIPSGFEESVIAEESSTLVPMPGIEGLADLKQEYTKKSRITITYKGESLTPAEWGNKYNMDPKRIRLLLRKGKTPEEIFGGR